MNEDKVGQRDGFTATDVSKINNFYGCSRLRARARKGLFRDFFEDVVQKVKFEKFEEAGESVVMSDPSERDDLGEEYWKMFDVKKLW